ncbi:hypothetical protein [Fictibacillus phosphorivorans]|nr:hypothetical protein [Fictibacillus phosphorivorans]
MGKLINLNGIPRPINLDNRKEKLEKKRKEQNDKYNELKQKGKDLYGK